MSWKNPLNRRANRNLLNNKRFFRRLAEQNNFLDKDATFVLYAGLVALVGEELRRHKVIRLPFLGDFGIVPQKSRPGWMGKEYVQQMGPKEVLRFYPAERLRRYFNKRQEMA